MDDDLFDRGFLAHVNQRAGIESYRAAKDFLARAGIPNPQSSYAAHSADPIRPAEFFEGPRVIRAYFNGLSLSVVHNEASMSKRLSDWFRSKVTGQKIISKSPAFLACDIKDRRILEPLLQIPLGSNACLEIVPGIERANIKDSRLSEIVQEMESRNIRFIDASTEFVGKIGKDGDESLLITNRRMVEAMKPYNFEIQDECPLQEKVFGDFRKAFRSGYESGNGRDLQEAFVHARANAQLPKGHPEKVLHSYWEESRHMSARLGIIASAAETFAPKMDPA